jgi:sporulation protein YlmC with PRC-barrel domain
MQSSAENAAKSAAPGQPGAGIIAAQEDGQALASDMIGSKVVTPKGEDLGKVDDLIVGQDGKVQAAVLSVGGFLGIGDKRVALPWQEVQKGSADRPLVVAMTKKQLEAAPEFMTLADQQAQKQAAAAPLPSAAVPAPAPAGAQ